MGLLTESLKLTE